MNSVLFFFTRLFSSIDIIRFEWNILFMSLTLKEKELWLWKDLYIVIWEDNNKNPIWKDNNKMNQSWMGNNKLSAKNSNLKFSLQATLYTQKFFTFPLKIIVIFFNIWKPWNYKWIILKIIYTIISFWGKNHKKFIT